MLFDLDEFRKPLPENVTVYASGANRETEIRGFSRFGIPVGVAVNHLNRDAIAALIELDRPTLIDSGAFSEVAFASADSKRVAPLDDVEWRRRLSIYLELASALRERATLVAPDKVGDQEETLSRLARYGAELSAVAATGATLLLPLQIGPLSHRSFFEAALRAARVPLVPAMPMRKAATSTSTLLSFVEEVKPERIHLLGIGIENRRAARLIQAIRYLSPDTEISMDSNRLRAVAGSARPLTRLETEFRNSEAEGVFGAVDSPVLALNGEALDYTDLISSPSLWAMPTQLRSIASTVGLATLDTLRFVDEPDTFLQTAITESEDFTWIEHPLMAIELDRAWQQFVQDKVRSGVRSAAIAGVFRNSRISDQAARTDHRRTLSHRLLG